MIKYEKLKHAEFSPRPPKTIDAQTLLFVHDRKYSSWHFMPQIMQRNYQCIADAYPGFQVHACGSRINGTYVDLPALDAVLNMRLCFDLPIKAEGSDYDYFIESAIETIPIALLKPNGYPAPKADRVKAFMHELTIALPMWDIKKIPIYHYDAVLDLIQKSDWAELVRVHDYYNLSPYSYGGCCGSIEGLKKWFWHFRDTGALDKSKDEEYPGQAMQSWIEAGRPPLLPNSLAY